MTVLRNQLANSLGAARGACPTDQTQKKRFYTREEDFLADYPATAHAAARFLGGHWHPDPACSDCTRKTTKKLSEHGKLKGLHFECAFIDFDDHGFLTSQIYLKSSKRLVVVLVELVNNELIAEKLFDRIK